MRKGRGAGAPCMKACKWDLCHIWSKLMGREGAAATSPQAGEGSLLVIAYERREKMQGT